MRFNRSIALPLIGLLVLVVTGTALVSQIFNIRMTESNLRASEEAKVRYVASIVEEAIRGEAPRLGALAKLMKQHAELNAHFVARSKPGGMERLRWTIDRIYMDAKVDVLQVSDAQEVVVYRAHDPRNHGDKPKIWGVVEAIEGEDTIVTSKGSDGLALRAVSPLGRDGARGSVMVGSLFNDAFARRIAKEVKAEVAFASLLGLWASSQTMQLNTRQVALVAQSLANKNPEFEYDAERGKAQLFVPFRFYDETFVLLVETDATRSEAMMRETVRSQVALTVGLLGAAILLGTLLTLGIMRPLTQLKQRAITRVAAITGEQIEESGGNEIDSLVKVIDRTTNALAEANREVSEREREVRLISDSLPLIVAYIDHEQRYRYVNRSFADWTGHSPEEIIGRKVHEIVGETLYEAVREQIETALRGEAVSYERESVGADGRRVCYYSRLVPKRVEGNVVQGYYALIEDITDRKRAVEDLRQAKLEAEAASRAKSEFVANMSHEIRTPMNGVLGMTELLLDTDLTDRQRHFARTIRNSGEALLNVINDILDFSKIEAGRMDLDCSPFDLRAVVEETAELLAARAHVKGIELACHVTSDVPSEIVGDAGRLRQVLTNLVGNAVKFTEQGEVVVAVRRMDTAGDGNGKCELEFSVTDTGIGMGPEAESRLFKPFSQVDGSMTRRFGGTGLGLAICRQLVHLMGGSISVESELHRGSRFSFVLSLGIGAASPQASKESDLLKGVRVLIVEDNPTNAAILQHYTEAWGMEPACVDRGEKALEAFNGGKAAFDLALIDWKLPGMSGPELARALRGRTGPSLPLVLLTSMTASNVAQTAREAGFNAYLNKPVRREELQRSIAAVLGMRTAMIDEPADDPAATTGKFGARVLLVEDNPVNREIGSAMLALLGCTVEAATNGAEAVRMNSDARYDVIMMDCQMPVMDGFAASRRIRSREQASASARIPIIALTANVMQGDRERCLAAGMDDYLAKPFKREQLEAVLARWIRPAHALEAGTPPGEGSPSPGEAGTPSSEASPTVEAGASPSEASPPPALQLVISNDRPASSGTKSAPAPSAVLDADTIAGIRALGRSSNDFLARVVARYVQDAPQLMEQLRAAMECADAGALRLAAHTLKSSSANLGAKAAAALCKELETLGRNGSLGGAPDLMRKLEAELTDVYAALEAEAARQAVG